MAEGVSNDVLAERITGVREDLAELVTEMQRARQRLHRVEGLTGMLVDKEKQRASETQTRQRRLELRIQVLTAVVAVAAFAEPFLYHIATGK
jgi:DNA repair exonuclease SbcCD ATPase subunit